QLPAAVGVHDEDCRGAGLEVVLVDDARAVGRPGGRHVRAFAGAELPRQRAVGVHHENPGVEEVGAAGVGDGLAVGRPGEVAVDGGGVGQTALVATVGVDEADVVVRHRLADEGYL